LLGDESSRRFNQMETALAGLHHLVVQQTQSAAAALVSTSQASVDAATTPPTQTPEPDGLKHLSTRARDIYFQLKAAAACHAGRAA